MKKLFLLLINMMLLVSCSKAVEVVVHNRLEFDRSNELVEFCLCSVENKLQLKPTDKIIILDKDNKQVPYQILSDMKTVLFPASVQANDSAVYRVLVGTPDSVVAKTYGRQVPERKDDFTWENDRIAFRMYGPALKKENASNGVDMWLKRTEDLIVNKFYKDELQGGKSYHIDHGQGLDCYKVGPMLGAGGIAPYVDKKLWVGRNYDRFKVLENGPLRTVFQLSYDSVRAGKRILKQSLVISIDAGSQLNKAVVYYEGEGLKTMPVAGGIFLHDSTGVQKIALDKGYIAYAENAVSDAGVASGRMYEGVYFNSKLKEAKPEGKHLLGITEYDAEHAFTYYFGAGWSKWGFPTDEDWFNYMDTMSQKLRKPLRASVR